MLNWEKPNTTHYYTWLSELKVFDFEIENFPGNLHQNADFFSRSVNQCQQYEILHENSKRKRNVKICNVITSEENVVRKKI